MFIVLVTFFCFIFANIASTIMVQAESRNRKFIAGMFEALYALFWIYAAKYALSTSPKEVMALLAGNFLGAYFGTAIGERFVKDHAEIATQSRIEEVEFELDITSQTLHELAHEIAVQSDEGNLHEHE